MSQRARLGLVLAAVLSFSVHNAEAAEEPPTTCSTGLILGVNEGPLSVGNAASDVVAAFCQPVRARNLAGIFRVSVVAVGNGIVVTATRVNPTTGVEESVRLQSRTIDEAVRDAPLLVAKLAGPPQATVASTPLKQSPAPPRPASSSPSPAASAPMPACKPWQAGRSDCSPPKTTAAAKVTTSPAAVAAQAPTAAVPESGPETVEHDSPNAVTSEPASTSVVDEKKAFEPTTRVEIRSSSRVQLQRNNGGRWETACMSPCNADVASKDQYRVVDNNGRALQALRFEAGTATIDFSPRNMLVDVVGTISIIAGTFLFYGGLLASADHDGSGTPYIAFGLLGIVAGPIALFANGSGITVKEARASSASSSLNPIGRDDRGDRGDRSRLPRQMDPSLLTTTRSSMRELGNPRAGVTAPILSFAF